MRLGWATLWAVAALAGCSSGPECVTTADCVSLGERGRQCVDGRCERGCERDVDCKPNLECEIGDRECELEAERLATMSFVCEDLVCRSGCPDVACGAGEQCVAGRCAYYAEGFEGAMSGGRVTLESLGWNRIPRAKRNTKLVIAATGAPGCGAESERDACAGPAGDGGRFLVVERQPANAQGTAEFGTTCRACTCCAECRDPLARTSTTASCPGLALPEVTMCTASPPAACAAICAACDQCETELAGVVPTEADALARLGVCGRQVAERTCSACKAHDACLRERMAENRACPGGAYPACQNAPTTQAECERCLIAECANLEGPCFECRNALRARADNPSEPELWRDAVARCDAQGDDGCWPAPKRYERGVLTEDEQSAESPVIDLSQASGEVVLELLYVPFDVGASYTRVVDLRPSRDWPSEPQRVVVQMCGGSCERPESWTDAAELPRADERDNGLLFALHNRADWTLGRLRVAVPPALRGAGFQFRLVPKLADDVRVGVDRVVIRRLP